MPDMNKDFTFISDPGHGWLVVDWTELKALGLNPTQFSRYSFRKQNTFYLEEDCDAPKFLEVWMSKNGRHPTFFEVHQEQTFIRDLPPIW